MKAGRATVSLLCLLSIGAALGLSNPVCDQIYQSYQSSSPQLRGEWPYYNLLYSCSGNLNVEGYSVDACVLSGSKCGQAAADAFCQYLGFDSNAPGLYSTTPAKAPAMSLTGEWCVQPGKYADLGHPNSTTFASIKSTYPGPYCSSLSSVSCIRTRDSLSSSMQQIRQAATSAPTVAQANPLEVSPGAAYLISQPSVTSAGRRMKVTS